MKKKILSLILAFCMIAGVVGALPVSVSAYTYRGTCGTTANYVFDSTTGTLTISGSGNMSSYTSAGSAPWNDFRSSIRKVVIENRITSIGGYSFYDCVNLSSVEIPLSVKTIGENAFNGCSGLINISIPYTVTGIGNYAFYNCSNLMNIEIPDGVTYIGSYAFYNCSSLISLNIPDGVQWISIYAFAGCSNLTSVEIPDSVTNIGTYAFSNCSSLTSLNISDSVLSIDDYAFYNCNSLTSVEIPNSVTSIGEKAFNSCYGLTEFVVMESNENYCSENGVLFNKDKTSLIQYPCKKTDSAYIVPDSVISIEPYAFYGCNNLTNVKISDGVTNIGEYAFYNCSSLKIIEIPESVTRINVCTFHGCNNLTTALYMGNEGDLVILSNNTPLGNAIQYPYKKGECGTNCSWILEYGSGTLTISGTGAIADYTEKTSLSAPWYDDIDYIKHVVVEDGVTRVGNYAFHNCSNLESVEIGNTVTNIGTYAFYKCRSLTGVELGNGVETIENNAFNGCSSLTSIEIPDSVESISYNAFYDCSSLKSLTIPNSVTSIGSQILFNCCSIEEIHVPFVGASRTAGGATDGVFGYLFGKTTEGEYVVANQYYSVLNFVEYNIPTSLEKVYITDATQIPYGSFEGCLGIDYIELNEGITQISQFAFANCDFLSVYMPKTVTRIGTDAFKYTDVEKLYVSKNSYCHDYAVENDYPYEFYDSDGTVSVTGVSLNNTAVKITDGSTYKLVANVLPEDATDKTVTWKSSNTNVATVANGVVTAVAEGSATITVTTVDGGYTAQCAVTVTALSTDEPVDENAPQVVLTSVKSTAGNTITVDVSIANNPGFVSLGLEIEYDSEYLTLTNIKSESGVGATFTAAQSYTKMPYNFGWSSTDNIYYDGKLATLTFTVDENAPDGIYPITLSYYKGVSGNYTDGYDVNYDENFDALGLSYVSGNIAVVSYTPGDINGDSTVNDRDATFLLRYLAGWTLNGIVEQALDVDGSGTVNDRDATTLLRYLAGWDIELH